ncbi:Ten1p [Saccharomyces cerevisiae x Saccharomyces kudriavzevii VIN7]|uniref:Ten1p n=1 Tax=Saccharomyces cerevisiae x Saccharomyces kudriavzevii (strain VIN7) TaxID=1095631 RepID=H0GY15_SACCK|nr:Ten1p [Saccharomyces cerevisiae x Saccharomyces kudriavzevii VIN7]
MSQLVVDLKCLKNKIARKYDVIHKINDGNEELDGIHPSERFRIVVRFVDFLFCESDEERTDGLFCKVVVRNLRCLSVENSEEEMCLYMCERLFSTHKNDFILIDGQVLDIRVGAWYGAYQSPPVFEIISFKILSESDVCDFFEFVRSPIGEKFLNISNL